MYYSKGFNSNYVEFVGYETCENLIWTSGKDCRITNTISKQGILKRNMNMTSPSKTLGFGCTLHNDTCDILLDFFSPDIANIFINK